MTVGLSILSSLVAFSFVFGGMRARDLASERAHDGSERRIQALEQAGAGAAPVLTEQGKQIAQLAGIVREDHDSIVKLATVIAERTSVGR
jgi:hypothetical protein